MDALIADLRFGWRKLTREPGFAAAVILMIALGIGTSVAIFSIVNGVLLQPLAMPDADRVVAVHRVGQRDADISLPDAVDIRRDARSFSALGVVMPDWSLDLLLDGQPVHVKGALTESGYFRALGLSSIAGRLLQPGDDGAGAPAVAVLAEQYWRTRFGADPRVVGRSIVLSDVPTTIIGIAPRRADVTAAGIEMWVSIAAFAPWAHAERGSNNFSAVGRLAQGVSVAAANEELRVLTTRLTKQYPDTNVRKVLGITPLKDSLVGTSRRALWILLAAVLIVLLISTANVATLLLLRSARRAREVSVRNALGAGRLRIARQLMTEGVLMSVIGGTLGGSVAWLGFGTIQRFLPATLPRLEETRPDLRVLAFAIALSIVTGIAFSLAPVWRLRKSGAAAVLGSARGVLGGGGRRALAPLIAGEIALALVLLAGASLLLRSFSNLVDAPLGFDPKGVAVAEVVLPESRYGTPDPQTLAFTRMVDELRDRPGVADAAFVVGRPQSSFVIGKALVIEGKTFPPEETPAARYRPYIGDVFRVLGIRIIRGRAPIERAGGVREAVVNERFVSRLLAGTPPLGARFAFAPQPGEEPSWMTIVGVAQDVKTAELRLGDGASVYAPYLQREDPWIRFGTLIAKVQGAPERYRDAMQSAVSAADRRVPIESFSTMTDDVNRALAPDRFSLQLVSLFGIIAVVLSMQGIFSVVAYDVEQRRTELSLRMALGARAADVLALVWRRGTLYAAIGLGVGAVAAFALTRVMESLLFEISPRDPLAFGGAIVLLALIIGAAVTLAALRVIRIDPANVLAEET